jgi:hypothetical protein
LSSAAACHLPGALATSSPHAPAAGSQQNNNTTTVELSSTSHCSRCGFVVRRCFVCCQARTLQARLMHLQQAANTTPVNTAFSAWQEFSSTSDRQFFCSQMRKLQARLEHLQKTINETSNKLSTRHPLTALLSVLAAHLLLAPAAAEKHQAASKTQNNKGAQQHALLQLSLLLTRLLLLRLLQP